MCWLHLRRDKGLRIKPSGQGPGAGMGLWAERDISRNRIIDPYVGQDYTREQLDHVYGDEQADYTLRRGRKCVDARRTNASAARFANTTTPQQQARRNAKLTERFNLTSKRNIPKGTEILTSYGARYRL